MKERNDKKGEKVGKSETEETVEDRGKRYSGA